METNTSQEALKKTIENYALWCRGDGGARVDLQSVDLRYANLRYADLRKADFRGTKLQYTDFHGAHLRGANFHGANLYGANFQGADFYCANFLGVDLHGARFQGADLRGANFHGANFHGANLYGVNFHGADLRGADFHGADLRCIGDMKYIKTLQLHMWMVGYTYDALQIGCEYHPIEKWREWNTPEKRERIDLMDKEALGVALQYLDLLLSIVDACPAERP